EVDIELYAYIGGIIKENSSVPIKINGTEDHIHILATMSKNIALAKFVEEIKRNSSRWIKTKGIEYQDFAWQGGYAGYSVSQSVVERVKKYIENQKNITKRFHFRKNMYNFWLNIKLILMKIICGHKIYCPFRAIYRILL